MPTHRIYIKDDNSLLSNDDMVFHKLISIYMEGLMLGAAK